MTESVNIRVAIIEDHDDFREGLYHVLQGTDGFRCVGRYASLEEGVLKMPATDVVLLDIHLPGKSGIEGLSLIKQKHPNAQVIMLTVFEDDTNIFRAIQAGADGYLLKKTPPARLLQAIEEAAAGGMPMTPFIARQAVAMLKRHVPAEGQTVQLTPRESEILALLTDGLNYSVIGERLFISLDTVRNHIRHIYEKLQVHS
ncbi:MAG TPA: response regulator transcription factor, partial [Bacteroidota bacterium]|nr:response regulator transcription factor [Bacteroidota bacterium]